MISLAFQQLRRRGHRYVSLFFAIFASVALAIAAVALTASLTANVNDLFGRPYERADFVLTVSADEPAEVDQKRASLDAAPHVEAFAWDQRVAVSLRDADAIYSGAVAHSIEPGPLQWRAVVQGRLPEGPGEIAVNATADAPALDSVLQIRVPGWGEDLPVTVVGQVEPAAQDALMGGTSVFATPFTVAGWNTGAVNGEFRVRGTDVPSSVGAVAAAEKHVEQLSAEYLGQRDRYFLLITAFVLVAAVVAFLVIFSAYTVLTAERRREFGLIRAIGASTPQILGAVTLESFVLGVLASGLGVPAGLAAARFLAGKAGYFGVRVPLETITVPGGVGWLLFTGGVAMPILAALPAALRACRGTTLEALSPPSLSRSHPRWSLLWLLLAALFVATGWTLSGYVPEAVGQRAVLGAVAAAGLTILGAAITAAVVLPVILFTAARLFGRTPLPSLQLGLAFPGQQKVRSAALVVVIFAGAALTSAVFHGQSRVAEHLLSSATARSGGTDITITALDQPLPADLVDSIRQLPGVAAAVAPATATVSFPEGPTSPVLLLAEAAGASVMRSGDAGAPTGTIMLGRSSGVQNTLPAGTNAEITINDVPINARVLHRDDAATLIDPALVEQTRQARAAQLGVAVDLLPAQPVRSVFVLLEGPAHQPADSPTIEGLRGMLEPYPDRFSVSENFSTRAATVDMVERITTMSSLLAVVALIIAAVGLINTVTLTVTERAPLRRLLRSVGLTPLNQTAVLSVELVSLALPAALWGATAGGLLGSYVAGVVTEDSYSRVFTTGDLDTGVIAGTVGALVLGAVLCGLVVLRLPRPVSPGKP